MVPFRIFSPSHKSSEGITKAGGGLETITRHKENVASVRTYNGQDTKLTWYASSELITLKA